MHMRVAVAYCAKHCTRNFTFKGVCVSPCCRVATAMMALVYPSLDSICLKTSFAASLMAFSGVTRVRFTAAPENTQTGEVHK